MRPEVNGANYQISRHALWGGNGAEEPFFSQEGSANIEYDDWGEVLWVLGEYPYMGARSRRQRQRQLKMTETAAPKSSLRRIRLLLWLLAALALAGTAALFLVPREQTLAPQATAGPVRTNFGGPFTLVGADGKPFSSQALAGKPYAIYFGFTRCGDVCPTTLSRLVRLRRAATNDQAMHVVFITIDPANDGPKEVGKYAGLFNAPIIGLTGNQAEIDRVKKQYGIFAQPSPHPMAGKEMMHTATVLLFDRAGNFSDTIAPDEPDSNALAKLRKLLG